MKPLFTILISALAFFYACNSEPQTDSQEETSQESDSPQNPAERFQEEIEAFEALDKTNMPAEGVIVFTGSSSIRMWKSVKEDMAPFDVINRGFGGSTLPDLLYYLDRIVLPYKPNCIVLYEGDNDITNEEVAPETVLENLKIYQTRLQQALPGTKTLFLAVKPSISRKHLLEKAQTTNELIRQYCEGEDLMEFVDIASVMMESEQKIRSDIFIEDSLHMNALGYELWTPVVKKALETHCQ